jgi:transcriptional regulator GlxA family with amidase domain
MAAHKTSAVVDENEPLDVLFALHPKFNLLDFAGPWEAFHSALHDEKDPESKAFNLTIASDDKVTLSEQDVSINGQISYKQAYEDLGDYDVLVVVGGNTDAIIEKEAEPLGIITAFSELHKSDPVRERTLFSVCTGSHFLAQKGILAGLSATTHPDHFTKFEILCSRAATRDLDERTEVVEDSRYVVNNLRFDLGNEDENPYIRRKSDARRVSTGRKGSISLRESSTRENITRRAAMRLGGLRVITSGGVTAGTDAALYLVAALVSEESALEVARRLQWTWQKGLVIGGVDV